MTSIRSFATRRRAAAWLTAAALGAGVAALPAAATAAPTPTNERSLATVLTSDSNHFDRANRDFDIVTEAVFAVLKAKPDSPVAVLADGSVPLTAFIPQDRAFRALVDDLTGRWYKSEKRILNELVAAVGVDAVESVLLYHVVPGATITASQALKADGAELDTALAGTSFTVDVLRAKAKKVRLIDNDRDDYNPRLAPGRLDINKGNKQIAHGITRVLRPLDL
jgi:uncharacterized surface protein with fasciclin (FAS1) repeats